MLHDSTSNDPIPDSTASSDAMIPFAFFPSAVVQLQKRGTITLPPAFRPVEDDSATLRLWLRLGPTGSLILDPLWTPDQLFAQYDAQVDPTERHAPDLPLPDRWLNAVTILFAQAHPTHPARAWCRECDAGFQSVQMDPVVIPDLLHRLPTLLPTLTRPALARYVASVCSWTGITLTDRNFYLAVLALWGASEAEWAGLVQRARETQNA